MGEVHPLLEALWSREMETELQHTGREDGDSGQVAEHLAADHLISTGNVVLQRLSLMNTKLVSHVQD